MYMNHVRQQVWENEEAMEFVKGVLTVAAEGGINYWADFRTARDPQDGFVAGLADLTDREEGELLSDYVGFSKTWRTLCRIAAGEFNDELPERIISWIRDDLDDKEVGMIDADAADCIVQLAVFDKVVYG